MGLWEIDGIMQDHEGRRCEEDFNIRLKTWGNSGVQVDSEILPIYCMYCRKQVDAFYKHAGSRYGQVGVAGCNHCGSVIYVNDHDNIVHEILTYTGDRHIPLIIDFYKVYRLEDDIWQALKEKNIYDIFARHGDGKWTTLQSVVNEICEINNIVIEDIPNKHILTDDKITKLPKVVNKWLNIHDYFHVC